MENLVNPKTLEYLYKGKRVFITGHTGFKGSWLSEWLLLLGATVKGYALPPATHPNHYTILDLSGKMDSVMADIRDKSRLEEALLEFQPDYIFHLAAQPLVRRSYAIPAETFDVNVTGTANLLESLIKLPKKCAVIVVTTDKVYENLEQDVLYKETDQLGGFDPYSTSKACTELVVQSFRRAFFSPETYALHGKTIGAARAGNVIGGGDYSEDRLVPDIIRALEKNEVLKLRYPNSIRPWQHVLEPLGGYLLWAGKLYEEGTDYSGAINFGPIASDHLTVSQVVDTAIRILGKGSWQHDDAVSKPHESGILKLDIQKAQQVLKWNPKWNATQAIQQTLEWYATDPLQQANITRSQILNYMQP
ncbi:MAG TPA: CDP-glucose 4,6-dehydratase [Chitinophagaceae bacterium]|nr:CDP-glucose 4,6-dehydratase [Chitinophagaceae bacterium]HML57710.1 CDP-glucose 4,6-dehydratase [Ferruginibacter sp.]